jgi:predicted transcriptional regulator
MHDLFNLHVHLAGAVTYGNCEKSVEAVMLNNSINIKKNETIKSHLKSLNIKIKKYHEIWKGRP